MRQLAEYWRRLQVPSEELLAADMERNPTYPFHTLNKDGKNIRLKISPSETCHGRVVLVLSCYYPALFVAAGTLLISLIILIALIVEQNYAHLAFIGSICGVLVSLAVINNYRQACHYLLQLRQHEYLFAYSATPWSLPKWFRAFLNTYFHGNKPMKEEGEMDFHVQMQGPLYNIFIRLCRESTDVKKRYYLVLNGYRVETRRISGYSTQLEVTLMDSNHFLGC